MDEAADPSAVLFWKNRNHWLYELARDVRLKPVSVRVGLLFGTFFGPDRDYLTPGYDWLMKNGHIKSRTTLSQALKELEATGYLVMERNWHHRNGYRLPFDGEAKWLKSHSP